MISTTPNVMTILTEISQAIKFAFIFFAAIFAAIALFLILTTEKFSHPVISHAHKNAFLKQKCADMLYLIQYANIT